MSGRDYDVIARGTGEVVASVRHLWPSDPEPCSICDQEAHITHSVPYYEEPVLEGESQGCYMSCCAACFVSAASTERPPCSEHGNSGAPLASLLWKRLRRPAKASTSMSPRLAPRTSHTTTQCATAPMPFALSLQTTALGRRRNDYRCPPPIANPNWTLTGAWLTLKPHQPTRADYAHPCRH